MYRSALSRSLLLIVLITTSTGAVSAETDTPLSIYRLAEKNDAEILAAYSALQAERETRNQSTGALKPSLSLDGDIAANREDVDTTGVGTSGETSYTSYDVGLVLRQPLYRKDLFTELDITDANILVAEAEYKAAQQDLITRVLIRFFEALAARDNLDFSCFTTDDRRDAMGIDWMTGKELSQAIPPAYTEWIGKQLMEIIKWERNITS